MACVNAITCVVIGIFVFFCNFASVAYAQAEFDEISLHEKTAYYVIKTKNILVGYAVVTGDDLEHGGDSTFFVKLFSRVGNTPLYFKYDVRSSSKGETLNNIYKLEMHKKVIENISEIVKIANGKASRVTENSKLIPANIMSDLEFQRNKVEFNWPSFTAAVPFKYSDYEKRENRWFYMPIINDVIKDNMLNFVFDTDGFAKFFTLPLSGAIELEFSREEKDKVKNLFDKGLARVVDFDLFVAPKSQEQYITDLTNEIKSCTSYARDIEKNIKRKSYGILYVLHRKLINLNNLCVGLGEVFIDNNKLTIEEKLPLIALQVKKTEKEPRRELLNALVTAPDWGVFAYADLKTQYPKITALIIKKAMAEIVNLFAIEEKRKTDVNLRVYTNTQAEKAVLKAIIKLKKFEVPAEVEVKSVQANEAGINALQYAKVGLGPDAISTLCEQKRSSISIDFTGTTTEVIRSSFLRGVWDLQSKGVVLSEILSKIYSVSQCKAIKIYVNSEDKQYLSNALDIREKEIFDVENRVQVSNGKYFKLKFFPGVYDISLFSYINGAVIGKKEFTILEKNSSNINITLP